MHDDLLSKIRKILAKAEDPAATPEESETYTAKAADLIAVYGIDRALLAESDPSSDIVGDRVVVLDPPYARDKASLLAGIAVQLRCRSVHRTRYPDGTKQLSVHLFGYACDLQRAEVLYTSLLLQASQGLARTAAPPWESVAAFRRSWLAGFTHAITGRLADAESRAESDADRSRRQTGGSSSVSLVLADRSVAVSAALDEEYPDLATAKRRNLSGSGGQAGWRAGQRANLGAGSPVTNRGRGQIAG